MRTYANFNDYIVKAETVRWFRKDKDLLNNLFENTFCGVTAEPENEFILNELYSAAVFSRNGGIKLNSIAEVELPEFVRWDFNIFGWTVSSVKWCR